MVGDTTCEDLLHEIIGLCLKFIRYRKKKEGFSCAFVYTDFILTFTLQQCLAAFNCWIFFDRLVSHTVEGGIRNTE